MKIKINEKIFCFPPYISTTWDNVKSLRVDVDLETSQELLVVALNDGGIIRIPNFDQKITQLIFAAHLKFIEQKTEVQPQIGTNISFISGDGMQTVLGLPFRLGTGGLDGLGAALQHNPSQANTPQLPEEILSKIASIAKVIGAEDSAHLPKPEPHCNCLHCQIARAVQKGTPRNDEMLDEEVSDEDLKFRLWDIQQSGDKLYTVKNPLDHQEQYNVYLGDPVGCTCGQKNCEHIRSVLNS
ncbi:MAG: hypothetical protein P4L16_01235 [Chlamydiales bacterium]|nr:hypothetical protein [Chlamydiales bacterium]